MCGLSGVFEKIAPNGVAAPSGRLSAERRAARNEAAALTATVPCENAGHSGPGYAQASKAVPDPWDGGSSQQAQAMSALGSLADASYKALAVEDEADEEE